jgi:hypothetical protein
VILDIHSAEFFELSEINVFEKIVNMKLDIKCSNFFVCNFGSVMYMSVCSSESHSFGF